MKRLIPLFTLAMALFAGNLMAQADEDNNTSKPPADASGEVKKPDPPPVEEPEKPDAEWGTHGDSGDQAWMITASALVLFMTLPGLALFYGGLVRRKNVLSVLVQCFAIACLMSILWVFYGYSLAFSEGNKYIGDLSEAFLKGTAFITNTGSDGTISESVFVFFQMTFAIITPALIVGAIAERMKFSAILVFMAIWFTFSYAPICHMVWGGGLISTFGTGGALDFAGGTVVHINAGVAALVACMVLGPRKGYGKENMAPHNVPLVIIGASMLWVGWFGFNAGSELAADDRAGMALLVTHVAAAVAAFSWMIIEWITKGKPTAVGLATGAVAGLVAITPASGFVGPLGALVIGVAAGLLCYWASTVLKQMLGYDDSLDVFGVHGVGGIVGALLTGFLVQENWGGLGLVEAGGEGNTLGQQMQAQFGGVVVTIVWTAVVAFIALKIAGAVCGGIRTAEDNETEGLDVTDHGESGYTL
jgi:Amt family ammonium transporter